MQTVMKENKGLQISLIANSSGENIYLGFLKDVYKQLKKLKFVKSYLK